MPENYLVPVFVFPTTLTFYVNDQSSHKQVLTLYNPYDHAVRFQVLCSSREKNKYSVVDPEGSINSHCNVDIVIRHNAVTSQNIGHNDKFRIQMFEFSSNKIIGRKDVVAELVGGKSDRTQTPDREMFQELPSVSSQSSAQFPPQRKPGVRPGDLDPVVVVLVVICIAILLLPTQGEPSSFLSDYLKPTVHLKLAVAYVLGLLTMKVLTPV